MCTHICIYTETCLFSSCNNTETWGGLMLVFTVSIVLTLRCWIGADVSTAKFQACPITGQYVCMCSA